MKKLIIILFIIALLSSCQATPEKEVVRDKNFVKKIINNSNNQILETKIYKDYYDAPKIWEDNIVAQTGECNILINSAISIPNVENFPILIIENDETSQEEIDKIIYTFTDNNSLYWQKELDQKDYLEFITQFKKNLAKLNSIETKNELDKYRINRYEKQIENYTNDMDDLPIDVERVLSDTNLVQSTEVETHFFLRLECDLDKSLFSKIDVDIDKELNTTLFRYKNLNLFERVTMKDQYNSMDVYNESKINDLRGLSITLEEAKNTAISAVKEMGYENFIINAVGSKTKSNSVLYKQYYQSPQCYVFYFTPMHYGIPVTYESTKGADNNLSKGWYYEHIIICVDDTGILYTEVVSPSHIESVKQENLKLLEFDEIKDKFSEQIIINGIWNNDTNIIHRTLHIDEITLGFMKVAIPDEPNRYLLIPVWDFFGYEEVEYDKNAYVGLILDDENKYRTRNFRHSYLTINAIDGSIIDRSLGY